MVGHETVRGLHEIGLIDKRRMRELDTLAHLDVEEMPPPKIKSLREGAREPGRVCRRV